MVVHACHLSYDRRMKRRMVVQANLGKKQDLTAKITKAKSAGA
jgi:hypothetical protein